MQKRRVGTISMAIVLIAFGIIIFIAQINKVSAVELSVKFWPMTLFLLGGELLWFSYKYKDEDIKVKYDVLSVFIVLLIVAINIGIYGLIETGMMSKISAMVSSQTFTYKIPYGEIEVDDEIEKIVVNSPSSSNLTIRTDKNNRIVSSGSLNITADSKEKAEELLNNEYIVDKKSGDTLYISFAGRGIYSEYSHSAHPYDFMLTIPENKKVEINGGSNLQLIADNIKNDWVIDNVSSTKIRLGKDIDAKINTSIYDKEMLRGNAKWSITGEQNDDEEISNIKGELIYGDGKNIINILNSDEVVVDELK